MGLNDNCFTHTALCGPPVRAEFLGREILILTKVAALVLLRKKLYRVDLA